MENQEKKSSSIGSILIIGGLSFWVWWLLQQKPKVCPVCKDCVQNPCPKCQIEKQALPNNRSANSCENKKIPQLNVKEIISKYCSDKTFIDSNNFEFFISNQHIYLIGSSETIDYDIPKITAFKQTKNYINRTRIIEDVIVYLLKNQPNQVSRIDQLIINYPQ